MLLVNIAIASDILDLFEMNQASQVQTELILVVSILTLWSISLLQVSGSGVFYTVYSGTRPSYLKSLLNLWLIGAVGTT